MFDCGEGKILLVYRSRRSGSGAVLLPLLFLLLLLRSVLGVEKDQGAVPRPNRRILRPDVADGT